MIRTALIVSAASLAVLASRDAAGAQAFTPGDRAIYQENFSAPRDTILKRLRDVHPRVSFQRHGDAPGLHARTPATFDIVLPEQLPRRYTLEFDFHIAGDNHVAVTTLGGDGDQGMLLCGPHAVVVTDGEGDDRAVSLDAIDRLGGGMEERVNHCAFSVDGDHVRAWVNNVRVADEAGLAMGRAARLRVEFAGVEDPTLLDQNIPVWLTNIRIAGFSQD
jgi:hypothetical protein